MLKTFTLVVVLASSFGCAKKKPELEGYRVVSYDGATGQWIILRNGTFDGKYLVKRITAVCDFYKRGDHEPVSGRDACSLPVGRLLVPNPLPREGTVFLDIWEMPPDVLFITEGDGPDRVHQQFTILKQEVLADNGSR